MKKIILTFIIMLAFGLRLYRLDFPLADWHSWRQADTASVSREFLKNGFDWRFPRYHDLSDVASRKDNPEGYRFVEYPLYNFAHAFLAKCFPLFDLEVWGRLLSIICSLGSLFFLYLTVKKYLNEATALLTAFFFAVLPFNVYYSRVILPEPMMLMTSLGMIYFFSKWFEKKTKPFLILAVFLAAASWLIKPFALVFLLPLVYLGWQKWGLAWKKYRSLVLSVLISALPLIWWRWWMSHYPEGIPLAGALFNDGNIRLKGAWFYWIFAERLGRLILGYWGLILFGLGLVVKPQKKEGFFFYTWLLAIIAYFVIVASGNVRHDYYQIMAVPIVCVFLAKGAYFLLTGSEKHLSRFVSFSLLCLIVLFMFAFSWYQVRDYFNINNPAIMEAGEATDRLVPAEAKVIAPYGGDTAFLYQTKRSGWPIGIQIERFIRQGATHYVNVNFDEEVDWLSQTYCVLEKTDRYVIIDLTKECQG